MLRALYTTLSAIVRFVIASAPLELAGAGLVVAGIWLHWGRDVGLISLGAALLLKALEADLSPPKDDRR